MALKVTVDNPAFPKGQEFDIRGLGIVVNGSATDITEEQERAYIAYTGKTVKDAFVDESLKVEGTSEVKGGASAVNTGEVNTVVEVTPPTGGDK